MDSCAMMYSKTPAYILGFHGCSQKTYNEVISKNKILKKSENKYDWLGSGIYFWENSYHRAKEWAYNRYGQNGAVVGAIIDLGYCLDLTDFKSVHILKEGYNILKAQCEYVGVPLPQNKSGGSKSDKLIRDLDCAVIETVHSYNTYNNLPSYDSVRGMFDEGMEMYPGACFKEKTHTQVCILNPNCIKGFFIPRSVDGNYDLP